MSVIGDVTPIETNRLPVGVSDYFRLADDSGESTAKSVYNADLIPAVNAITFYRGSRCMPPTC
jgi:hypothetical protein